MMIWVVLGVHDSVYRGRCGMALQTAVQTAFLRGILSFMAAMAQISVPESAILEALAPVPLPEGIMLQRIEFRNDSTGDPALFLTYSVMETPGADEARAVELQQLRATIRQRFREFGLPLLQYTAFVAA